MSAQADIQRTTRQKGALPGSRHDWKVRFLRVFLPSVIGALLAVLAFSPFSNTREMSFVLAKDEVNLAKERMRLSNAVYRGEDNKGRPFSLVAANAVQRSSDEPIVRMENLEGKAVTDDGPVSIMGTNGSYDMRADRVQMVDVNGQLTMRNGPASITASQGLYDMKAGSVRVDGVMTFITADGFRLTANNVNFLLDKKTMQSFGPVNGSTRVGTFRAGRMFADANARIVRLEGGAHLQINQGAIR
jgi:lipopolysaccharide export system protein LptC